MNVIKEKKYLGLIYYNDEVFLLHNIVVYYFSFLSVSYLKNTEYFYIEHNFFTKFSYPVIN
jgi:hypothetical protein